MAMNANTLGAAMKAKRDAVMASHLKEDMTEQEASDYRLALAEADAEAIIEHISTFATISNINCQETLNGQGPHAHNVHTGNVTGWIS